MNYVIQAGVGGPKDDKGRDLGLERSLKNYVIYEQPLIRFVSSYFPVLYAFLELWTDILGQSLVP